MKIFSWSAATDINKFLPKTSPKTLRAPVQLSWTISSQWSSFKVLTAPWVMSTRQQRASWLWHSLLASQKERWQAPLQHAMGQTWPAAEPQHIPSKHTVNLKTPLLPLEETAALFFNNATHFEERFVLAGDSNTKQAKGAIKEPFKRIKEVNCCMSQGRLLTSELIMWYLCSFFYWKIWHLPRKAKWHVQKGSRKCKSEQMRKTSCLLKMIPIEGRCQLVSEQQQPNGKCQGLNELQPLHWPAGMASQQETQKTWSLLGHHLHCWQRLCLFAKLWEILGLLLTPSPPPLTMLEPRHHDANICWHKIIL